MAVTLRAVPVIFASGLIGSGHAFECLLTIRLAGLRLAAAIWPGGVHAGQCLPGGAGEVGGDDVGRVPVQAAAGAVVPHRGQGIGVRGGFLHIPQWHPGI
jgi:hypothetical protein